MLKTGIDFSLLLKLQAISWLPEPVAGSAGCLGNSASLKREPLCLLAMLYGYGYGFKASPSGCWLLHVSLTAYSVLCYPTPRHALPLTFPPCCCTVQLTDCVSNSMKARRKMPFIIFTSRANNKDSRLFHIPHPVGPPSRHVVAVVVLAFACRLCRAMAYYYYLCVLYFRVLLLHFSYTLTHTPAHRDTVAYSLRNRTFSLTSHWVQQVAYATSATSFVAADSCWMRELSSHPVSVVLRQASVIYVHLSHPPFKLLPPPSTNPQFKIVSSAAHLVARPTSR